MNKIPTYQRLNINVPADIAEALKAEARTMARQTGPHCAWLLTKHIRDRQARMCGKGAR